MLTKIEAHTPSGSVQTFLLGASGPNTDAIQIRDIEGLGPVKASVSTTPLGSFDGEFYTGSAVGKRNIVIILGLNPNWADQSMESLRQLLYAYFMPKESVKLRFFSDTMPDVEINGYVEGLEPNIFSRDPEIQLSIICPQPDFVAVTPTIVTGVVGSGSVVPIVINYIGTVPTGFILKVASSAARASYTGTITVKNNTLVPQTLISTATVDTTQYFEISTRQGLKYVRTIVIANGSVVNLLSTIAANAIWPRLNPGVNNFSVAATSSGQTWTLTYFNRFGGL